MPTARFPIRRRRRRRLARTPQPAPAHADPLTGQPIRADRHSDRRAERQHPGELIHIDVKKIDWIPAAAAGKPKGRGIGYVPAGVDDHTRLAYAEILPDGKVPAAAAFLRHVATGSPGTASASNV